MRAPTNRNEPAKFEIRQDGGKASNFPAKSYSSRQKVIPSLVTRHRVVTVPPPSKAEKLNQSQWRRAAAASHRCHGAGNIAMPPSISHPYRHHRCRRHRSISSTRLVRKGSSRGVIARTSQRHRLRTEQSQLGGDPCRHLLR